MKKLFFIVQLFVAITVCAADENPQGPACCPVEQTKVVDQQLQMQQNMLEGMRDFQINLTVKFWDDFQWLDQNYVNDPQKGDLIIAKIKKEVCDNLETITDAAAAGFKKGFAIADQTMIDMFRNTFKVTFVASYDFTLKEAALVKSTAYQKVQEQKKSTKK